MLSSAFGARRRGSSDRRAWSASSLRGRRDGPQGAARLDWVFRLISALTCSSLRRHDGSTASCINVFTTGVWFSASMSRESSSPSSRRSRALTTLAWESGAVGSAARLVRSPCVPFERVRKDREFPPQRTTRDARCEPTAPASQRPDLRRERPGPGIPGGRGRWQWSDSVSPERRRLQRRRQAAPVGQRLPEAAASSSSPL